MKRKSIALGLLLATATAALAHQGVQNPAVKARMDGMSAIAKNMKTLGQMSKGATAFDAAIARSAAAAIAEHAAATPGLFEANETDPKSEARSEIWSNFEDFAMKATELETIAVGFSTSINDPTDLNAAMAALGANCKSC
ncbi:cytochrome c, partial [Ruegeria sp. 2205SS24-7]|uniref:c-type cytochrome n=1 Tax=Ruegeria discodermiae TaxID=3064389 RepID=UPI002741FD9E